MLINYTDIFIVSAPACLGTDADSLEAIMAGNEAGANGCAVDLDVTADGIAVLCANGGYTLADGSRLALSEATFAEARAAFPKIVSVGQVIELAKSCAPKLCIHLKDVTSCAQLQLVLHHADYADGAYFTELTLEQAAKLAARFPTLQFMADVLETPENQNALLHAAQSAGLFGLRVAPSVVTPTLCEAAHSVGLLLATTECHDEAMLQRLIGMGVNFIETLRPDVAYGLLPTEADQEQLTI